MAYFGPNFKGAAHLAEEITAARAWGSCFYRVCSQEAGSAECQGQLTSFFLLNPCSQYMDYSHLH